MAAHQLLQAPSAKLILLLNSFELVQDAPPFRKRLFLTLSWHQRIIPPQNQSTGWCDAVKFRKTNKQKRSLTHLPKETGHSLNLSLPWSHSTFTAQRKWEVWGPKFQAARVFAELAAARNPGQLQGEIPINLSVSVSLSPFSLFLFFLGPRKGAPANSALDANCNPAAWPS